MNYLVLLWPYLKLSLHVHVAVTWRPPQAQVMQFMEKNFPGSVMREKQNAKMRFEFPPQENQTLAQMFGFIEVC